MKPYDVLFLILLVGILMRKRGRLIVALGIGCLVLSLINYELLVLMRQPSQVLSSLGIGSLRISFETAAHLVWYAAAFFLCFIFTELLRKRGKQK
jgi:threonine/homoserine/homoserine lactone efflux protein